MSDICGACIGFAPIHWCLGHSSRRLLSELDLFRSANILHHLRTVLWRHSRILFASRVIRYSVLVGPLRPLWIFLARVLRRTARPAAIPNATLFPHFDAALAAASLDRDGVTAGPPLEPSTIDELVGILGSNTVIANPHEQHSIVRRIMHDPAILQTARQYLGAEPIPLASFLGKSCPGHTDQHANRFHFDVCDVKSLVLFIYLTDVGPDSFVHIVIKNTHSKKSWRELLQIYLTNEEAELKYGDQILMITGSKGTSFFEEQTAFHRVLTGKRERIMLGITYSLVRH